MDSNSVFKQFVPPVASACIGAAIIVSIKAPVHACVYGNSSCNDLNI